LNLADRTFTYINLRVQPKGVGLAIYGLITVIPQSTNRTSFKDGMTHRPIFNNNSGIMIAVKTTSTMWTVMPSFMQLFWYFFTATRTIL